MNDIERGLVARYLARVLARGDLPLRGTRHILHWLNERADMLSLPIPKPLSKAIGSSYGSAFNAAELDRIYRVYREQVISDLSTAARETERPEPLAGNIQLLVRELGLPPIAWKVVALVACYSRYEQVEFLCDAVSEVITPMGRAIATLVGEPARTIDQLVGPSGELVGSGILRLNDDGEEIAGFRGRYQIPQRINSCLDQRYESFSQMRQSFLGSPIRSGIDLSDYDHVETDRDLITAVLRGAARENATGVNILLYGPPGSGKTELCKVAAAAAGLTLYAAGEDPHSGAETDRTARLSDLVFALRLLSGAKQSAVLFDEMEDVAWQLIGRGGSKLYLNRILERSPVPVLWTSNNIFEIDPALLRRMTLAIELKLPPARQRERILRRLSNRHGVSLSDKEVQNLARRLDATPAVMENALKAARYAGMGAHAVERAASGIVRAVSGVASRNVEVIPDFAPQLACADRDLVQLTDQLADGDRHAFSLCLSGPPGTGKSAYARYLARRLGMEVLHKRASDLLGAFVGESEKRIADAFEEARETGALLIFDEAESFLFDRRDAIRSWEVTQVNEMLTWMEEHSLPVCFTTNLVERFDFASLRRFTFHIRFTYLDKDALARAYQVFFGLDKVPDEGFAFGNLTPGDFAQVRRQAEVLGLRGNTARIIEMLGEASRNKPGAASAVGFVR